MKLIGVVGLKLNLGVRVCRNVLSKHQIGISKVLKNFPGKDTGNQLNIHNFELMLPALERLYQIKNPYFSDIAKVLTVESLLSRP